MKISIMEYLTKNIFLDHKNKNKNLESSEFINYQFLKIKLKILLSLCSYAGSHF